jgi:hypothetical protein
LADVFVLKVILKLAVYKYMLNGQKEMSNANFKLLEKITQTSENLPNFKRLHKMEQDKSIRQYSDVIYRYLLYFTRRGREPNLNSFFEWQPLSPELETRLNELFQACHTVVDLVKTCLEQVSFLDLF